MAKQYGDLIFTPIYRTSKFQPKQQNKNVKCMKYIILEQRVEKKTETKKVVKIEKEQILENFMAYDVDDIQHSSFTTALNILSNDFDGKKAL